MDALKTVFKAKAQENKLVTIFHVTAGCPTPADTVPVLLSMERGGADIIELGVPFSEAIDEPRILAENTVALGHDVHYAQVLRMVKDAREQGLKVPILLKGYYSPLTVRGEEERSVHEAFEAGVNGFILVDAPADEVASFRACCDTFSLSFIPLVGTSTPLNRVKSLVSAATSFIYVAGKPGTSELANMIDMVRQVSSIAVAIHLDVQLESELVSSFEGVNGILVRDRLLRVIEDCDGALQMLQMTSHVEGCCRDIRDQISALAASLSKYDVLSSKTPDSQARSSQLHHEGILENSRALPSRFGDYGGQYVPEHLVTALSELETAYKEAIADTSFKEELESHFGHMNRPSQLYLAEGLTKHAGGATIWLKREDLNHTGSHKINNTVGQILLAKRLGKTRIVAETGAGQHGVATATVCAKFALQCVIYMGAEDVRRQSLNVFRIQMLGASVIPVSIGSGTLKEAVNEALRDWVTNLSTTHFLVGSAIGPHPFPTIVRDFQKIIGEEIKTQLRAARNKLPDAIVACVGGGSNAIGAFYEFLGDNSVKLVGVEAAGEGVETNRHSATLTKGVPGVLHGVRTYLLQSPHGQVSETHSISAGLNYPGVGPEHASLKDSGRAVYVTATDEQALRGFRLCTQLEGIIPALESSHAIWEGMRLATELGPRKDIVVNLSGRGDKDVEEVSKLLSVWADRLDWHVKS